MNLHLRIGLLSLLLVGCGIQDPLARYDAVMGIGDLFVVEPIAK
jgi:hypothetical protein